MLYDNKITRQQFADAVNAVLVQVPAPINRPFPAQLRLQILARFPSVTSADDANRAVQHQMMIRAIEIKAGNQFLGTLIEYTINLHKYAATSAAHPADTGLAHDMYGLALEETICAAAQRQPVPLDALRHLLATFAASTTPQTKIYSRMVRQAYDMVDTDPDTKTFLNNPQALEPGARQHFLQMIHHRFMAGINVGSVRVESPNGYQVPSVDTSVMTLNLPGCSPTQYLNALFHLSAHLVQIRAGVALQNVLDNVPPAPKDKLHAAIIHDDGMMSYAACMYVSNILFPEELSPGDPAIKHNPMEIEAFDLGEKLTTYANAGPARREVLRTALDQADADRASRQVSRANLTAILGAENSRDETRRFGRP